IRKRGGGEVFRGASLDTASTASEAGYRVPAVWSNTSARLSNVGRARDVAQAQLPWLHALARLGGRTDLSHDRMATLLCSHPHASLYASYDTKKRLLLWQHRQPHPLFELETLATGTVLPLASHVLVTPSDCDGGAAAALLGRDGIVRADGAVVVLSDRAVGASSASQDSEHTSASRPSSGRVRADTELFYQLPHLSPCPRGVSAATSARKLSRLVSLAFSPSGRWLGVLDSEGWVALYRVSAHVPSHQSGGQSDGQSGGQSGHHVSLQPSVTWQAHVRRGSTLSFGESDGVVLSTGDAAACSDTLASVDAAVDGGVTGTDRYHRHRQHQHRHSGEGTCVARWHVLLSDTPSCALAWTVRLDADGSSDSSPTHVATGHVGGHLGGHLGGGHLGGHMGGNTVNSSSNSSSTTTSQQQQQHRQQQHRQQQPQSNSGSSGGGHSDSVVTASAFDSETRVLVIGTADGTVALVDTAAAAGAVLCRVPHAHDGRVTCVRWDDGNEVLHGMPTFFTGASDGTLRVWRLLPPQTRANGTGTGTGSLSAHVARRHRQRRKADSPQQQQQQQHEVSLPCGSQMRLHSALRHRLCDRRTFFGNLFHAGMVASHGITDLACLGHRHLLVTLSNGTAVFLQRTLDDADRGIADDVPLRRARHLSSFFG
ncbi:MAG: hypothetical protein MHM6MM_008826, partial [Cercozoa sp. M6MM]